MWLFYGEEEFAINIDVKKLVQTFAVSPIIFDETSDVNQIINEIQTIPFLDSNKVVIVKNFDALFEDEEISKKFANSLMTKPENNRIIFTLGKLSSKASKSHLFKLINDDGQTKIFNQIKVKDIPSKIVEMVSEKNGSISYIVANILASKLPENMMLIDSELNKLLIESKIITQEMVENSVIDYQKDDFFLLTSAIVKGKAKDIIFAFNQKMKYEEPIFIINQVASLLTLTLQVASYLKQGYNDAQISQALNIHIFRIKNSRDLLLHIDQEKLKNLIKELSILDNKIKVGSIDPKLGLMNFSLQLIN